MLERGSLFVPTKMDYVQGARPDVECIFCAIEQQDKKVDNLEIMRNDLLVLSANLYPYNPGHLLIFPRRHVTHMRQLSDQENQAIFQLQKQCFDILDQFYSPQGYNVGYNIGRIAGGSIEHLHMHIVPRYMNEIGFLDIINQDRIIVEDPRATLEKLRKAFAELNS